MEFIQIFIAGRKPVWYRSVKARHLEAGAWYTNMNMITAVN